MIEAILFWSFTVLAVASALGVILHKSIIYNALFLIVVFLSIAGFFVLNNADFLAVAQTIVYAVGLIIVLLFGVMFTGQEAFSPIASLKKRRVAIAMIFAAFAALLIVGLTQHPYISIEPSQEFIKTLQLQGTTQMIGMLLFQNYLLPFEIVSILLLVAMIGAILLAKFSFAEISDPAKRKELFQHLDSTHARSELVAQMKQSLGMPSNNEQAVNHQDPQAAGKA